MPDSPPPISDPRLTAKQFCDDVCKALDLNPARIRSITLKAEANSPVMVLIERLVSRAESGAIALKLEDYLLAQEITEDDEI